MSTRFVIEPLKTNHERGKFRCGNERIDRYFHQVISQDLRRNYATCCVALDNATQRVAGFYTLSAHGIPLAEVPPELSRKLPPYPTVPAVLIGWLGVDQEFQGQQLGALLLFDAAARVARSDIGAHAVFADAIDDGAAAFYRKFGFIPFNNQPRTLFLPISTALKRARG